MVAVFTLVAVVLVIADVAEVDNVISAAKAFEPKAFTAFDVVDDALIFDVNVSTCHVLT